ncbi:hypothetical protein ABPG72_009155 [Tetrahymena utriculariae]
MRLFTIIFISLLIGIQCTSISDKYPSLKKKISLVQMMTNVESKMGVKAPIQEIFKLVDDYKDSVLDEQLNQNNLFDKQNKECVDEIDFREKEIESASDAVKKAQTALDSCKSQNARAQSDLDTVNNQVLETQNYLSQIIATREQQADDFQKAAQAYSYNADAADEAIEILSEIWSGEASFVQLANHANRMLVHAIQIKKVHKLTPVMTALAQLAAKKLIADEALINNVMSLLRDFRASLEVDFQNLQESEQSAIEQYHTNKSRTEDFLFTLQKSQKDLQAELVKLSQCINNQSAIFTTAQAKLQRNTQLLDAAQNMCSSFKKEYDSATNARNQELELIEVIRQKLEAKYGQLSELVKERASEDSFGQSQSQDEYIEEQYQPDKYY